MLKVDLDKTYRDEIYSLQILLSRTQAGPGREVKQEQEEISPNHVQRLNLLPVQKHIFGPNGRHESCFVASLQLTSLNI